MKKNSKPELSASWWNSNKPKAWSDSRLEVALADYVKGLVLLEREKSQESFEAASDLLDQVEKQAEASEKVAREKPKKEPKDYDAEDFNYTAEVLKKFGSYVKLERKRLEDLVEDEEQGEDEEVDKGLLLDEVAYKKYLKKMMKRLQSKAYVFALALSKPSNPEEHRFLFHKSKEGKILGKQILDEVPGLEMKKLTWGMASADPQVDTTLVLVLEHKQLPAMIKQGNKFLKAYKPLPFDTIKLVSAETGGELQDLPDPEDKETDKAATPTGTATETSTPSPKEKPDLLAQLTALTPRIKEFVAAAEASGNKAGADLEAKKSALAPKNRLLTLVRDCKAMIGTNDEQAEAMLVDIESILNEGQTSTPGPKEKPDLMARLNALIPRIKEFVAVAEAAGLKAGPDVEAKKTALAPKNRLLTLVRDCKGMIGTNDEQAEAMLVDIESILNGGQVDVTASPHAEVTREPSETYESKRAELAPRVKEAADGGSSDALKHQRLLDFAADKAEKRDFLSAVTVLTKLEQLLDNPTPASEPAQQAEVSTSKVDSTQALLLARGEIGRIRALMASFGPSWPTVWGSLLESAENAVESVAGGTLKEIQDGAASSDKILKELEPKITELTGKKREFEQKATALEGKHTQLGTLNAVVKDAALKKRHEKLLRDLQAARDLGEDEFKYDEAIVAVDEAMNKALQMDKESDAWDKRQVIYNARQALVTEATQLYNGLTSPVQELTDARDEIQTVWNKAKAEWTKTAYAESIAASDTIPALVAAFKRKATIFIDVGHYPPIMVTFLQDDRNKYGDRFDKLYPQSLIDSIAPYAATTYKLKLDDKTYGDLRGIWSHMLAVRARADTGVLYFNAADALTKARNDLVAAEPSRRALQYVAPDYREKVRDALEQGKTAANRQEFAKAKTAVDAGQKYSDELQPQVTRCLTYLTALDETKAQLEKVQQQHTTESAKAAAQACVKSVQEAETLALARDFDAAEKQLESVRKLLDDIAASEQLAKSLADAKQAPERTAGSEEMNKDIALIESAIKSAEESSSKSGVNFEWNTLSNAKMSLVAMRRANRDGDANAANQERQKALDDLSGLTEQLSSLKTARTLQSSLQTAIQDSEALFSTLAANALDVAKALSTEFTDIKAEFAKKVTEPLAGNKQPAFEGILEALASLQNRLATWRAAAPQLAPFGSDAAQAEIVIAELETIDVPAVAAAYGGFDATFKTPLEKLPTEDRHKDLRKRKDTLVKDVTIATLPKGAADMKGVVAEATVFKKEAVELKAAVTNVGVKLNANVVAIKDRVAQLGCEEAFDKLLKVLEAAAQSGSASGISTAANDIVHFNRMLQQLASSRTSFLNTYNGLNLRLTTAKSSLTSLAKSQSVDRAVTALQERQASPIGTELERLKLAAESDSNFYPAAVVDIAKVEPKLVQLEKDVAGLQPLAAPAEALEKQLKGLTSLSQIAAFKTAIERAESLSQSAGQAMIAVPPDFTKAKQDLEAAAKLATGATQASTGVIATAPQAGSDGAPDYAESIKQLRTRHAQLNAATIRLKLDPKGIEPLEKVVNDIEKLSAEVV